MGFVKDLNQVLQKIDEPTLVVPGDLPLLDKEIVEKIISKYKEPIIWNSILVTREFLESLNMKSEFHIKFQNKDCIYTGISLVNSKKIKNLENIQENYILLNDKRVAFNLNTKEDYELLSAS